MRTRKFIAWALTRPAPNLYVEPRSRSQRSAFMFRGGLGSLASLAAPARLRGKVVTVVGAKHVLDDGALEVALATLPHFAAPGKDGAHC